MFVCERAVNFGDHLSRLRACGGENVEVLLSCFLPSQNETIDNQSFEVGEVLVLLFVLKNEVTIFVDLVVVVVELVDRGRSRQKILGMVLTTTTTMVVICYLGPRVGGVFLFGQSILGWLAKGTINDCLKRCLKT